MFELHFYLIYSCRATHTHTHTHREEACGSAAQARLPVYGVVIVPPTGDYVYSRYDDQVDAHAEVRKGQVAHEETGNSQFAAAACETDG